MQISINYNCSNNNPVEHTKNSRTHIYIYNGKKRDKKAQLYPSQFLVPTPTRVREIIKPRANTVNDDVGDIKTLV